MRPCIRLLAHAVGASPVEPERCVLACCGGVSCVGAGPGSIDTPAQAAISRAARCMCCFNIAASPSRTVVLWQSGLTSRSNDPLHRRQGVTLARMEAGVLLGGTSCPGAAGEPSLSHVSLVTTPFVVDGGTIGAFGTAAPRTARRLSTSAIGLMWFRTMRLAVWHGFHPQGHRHVDSSGVPARAGAVRSPRLADFLALAFLSLCVPRRCLALYCSGSLLGLCLSEVVALPFCGGACSLGSASSRHTDSASRPRLGHGTSASHTKGVGAARRGVVRRLASTKDAWLCIEARSVVMCHQD